MIRPRLFSQASGALAAFQHTGFDGVHVSTERRVQARTSMLARLDARLHFSDDQSADGRCLSFDGTLRPAGVRLWVAFRDGEEDLRSAEPDSVATMLLTPEAGTVVLPHVADAPLGEPAWTWVRFVNQHGEPLGPEVFLGRCDDRALPLSVVLHLNVEACAWLMARDFRPGDGPTIAITGDLSFLDGVIAEVHTKRSPKDDALPVETRSIPLLAPGHSEPLGTGEAAGKSRGTPWVTARFTDPLGEPCGQAHELRRCVALH